MGVFCFVAVSMLQGQVRQGTTNVGSSALIALNHQPACQSLCVCVCVCVSSQVLVSSHDKAFLEALHVTDQASISFLFTGSGFS